MEWECMGGILIVMLEEVVVAGEKKRIIRGKAVEFKNQLSLEKRNCC
jgi:hypothetical protein